MKRIFLAAIILLLNIFSYAQSVSPHAVPQSEEKVYTFVEHNPEYPGGDAELLRFIQQNIVYPEAERSRGITGHILTRFVINEIGGVEDVQIMRSLSPALDLEAIRVVKLLKFKPGYQDGKPVKVYFNIPIVFKL